MEKKSTQNKKGLTFYVLYTLIKYSDEKHFLMQQDIIDLISQSYGTVFERKAIASSITLLRDLGYDVIQIRGKGYYLKDRFFSQSEMSLLVDAIYSCKSITTKQARSLVKKIYSNTSMYHSKGYDYLLKSEELSRTDNNDVLSNIALIGKAIKENKKITFKVSGYDDQGKPCFRKYGKEYTVSPYYLVNSNGRYYLLANYEKYDTLTCYRVDYLNEMKMEKKIDRRDTSEIEELKEGFDIGNYVNNHIYMFGGEAINAKIELLEPNVALAVKDWFGNNANIYYEDYKVYASVKCNEQGFIYWALQYGEKIKVLEPSSTVEKLKASAQKILENLNK